jgi:hypothetical protein
MTDRVLLARLEERAARLMAESPLVPEVKALLSVDGGACPRDGTALAFDPWSPHRHRCPRCGGTVEGRRHHRAWARFQHLWLGERIAHLAALATVGDRRDAGLRAVELITRYGERYLDYPNADNVLGPGRLFFSTYLESIWVTNVMAGATLLRDADLLDADAAAAVDLIANEAAALIGEFNEGFSNRQTWHNAALIGIAAWFEDEELLRESLEGATGMVAHLTRGFGADGMWFEGENYHLFALRGLLIGLDTARATGLDAFQDPDLGLRLGAALRAPLTTALPDLTFPARKDSRFGVSLAQPMYLELWEAGAALLPATEDLRAWLQVLHAAPAPEARDFDSYLHEAGFAAPARRTRADLSWWMLTLPAADEAPPPAAWTPVSRLLASQGLAVLRSGQRYVSLECGITGGGHGHPDRLHLTLHQDGVPWLPDPGTGSYVSRDLSWYRSTLAHNAPRLDGVSQPVGEAVCEYFDAGEAWSWVRGRFGEVTRTVVSGPEHLLDIVELASAEEHVLELPWHLSGDWEITSPGRWEPAALHDEFVSSVERWVPLGDQPPSVRAESYDAALSLTIAGADLMLRGTAPGVPGAGPAVFLLARATGRRARLTAVMVRGHSAAGLAAEGELFTVEQAGSVTRHHPVADGWLVETAGGTVTLGGHRPPGTPAAPSASPDASAHAVAHFLGDDGPSSLASLAPSLLLDRSDQYRRSEDPWAEDESFTATAWVGWRADGLALVVDVRKPECCFRSPDMAPLLLDNEPEDIHSDGLELFVRPRADGPVFGFLLVPEAPGSVRVRSAGGTSGEPAMVNAAWQRTGEGYRVEAALIIPGWDELGAGDAVGFDLLVNEMRPGRERRAGQLVWSGDGGWVWLRGDRHDSTRFGVLELGA